MSASLLQGSSQKVKLITSVCLLANAILDDEALWWERTNICNEVESKPSSDVRFGCCSYEICCNDRFHPTTENTQRTTAILY